MKLTDTMTANLETTLAAAERAELVAEDTALDPERQRQAALEFVRAYAGPIVDFLHELRERRQDQGLIEGGGGRGYQRTHVEGYSDTSPAEALADALNKSVKYFTETSDVALILERLVSLQGGGHRATIEVRVTPMRLHLSPHVQGMDVQLHRIHDHGFYANRKLEDEHVGHMIFDHFAASRGAPPVPIPPYFMINVNDAYLLNHVIEKQFLNAGHKVKNDMIEGPQPVLVRTVEPAPILKPRGT